MKDQINQIEQALKKAGYQRFGIVPGANDDLINIWIEPGTLLDKKTKNWPALPIIKNSGLKFRDVHLFDNRLIFKGIFSTLPNDAVADPVAASAKDVDSSAKKMNAERRNAER